MVVELASDLSMITSTPMLALAALMVSRTWQVGGWQFSCVAMVLLSWFVLATVMSDTSSATTTAKLRTVADETVVMVEPATAGVKGCGGGDAGGGDGGDGGGGDGGGDTVQSAMSLGQELSQLGGRQTV